MAVYAKQDDGIVSLEMPLGDFKYIAFVVAEFLWANPQAEQLDVLPRIVDIFYEADVNDLVADVLAEEASHGHSAEELAEIEAMTRRETTAAGEAWARHRAERANRRLN